MAASAAIKPEKGEFLPFYGKYIDLVASGDVLATLSKQMAETQALLRSLLRRFRPTGTRLASGASTN